MRPKDKDIKKEGSKYLGASDIVNGTAPLYKIEEKEMESAIEDIMDNINKE
jgi:hypothetical protein